MHRRIAIACLVLTFAFGGCATKGTGEIFRRQVRQDLTEVPSQEEWLWSFRLNGEGPFFADLEKIGQDTIFLGHSEIPLAEVTDLHVARVMRTSTGGMVVLGMVAWAAALLYPVLVLRALSGLN